MTQAFVGAGSNISPEKNIREAIRLLAFRVAVRSISTVYLTDPVGRPGQPAYFNCVLSIDSSMPPLELKNVLREIENKLGRMRSGDKSAPRTIDLDLLIYGNRTMEEEELTLPDPDILSRPFLTVALAELDPGLILPGTGIPVCGIAENAVQSGMTPLSCYTALLREELRYGFRP